MFPSTPMRSNAWRVCGLIAFQFVAFLGLSSCSYLPASLLPTHSPENLPEALSPSNPSPNKEGTKDLSSPDLYISDKSNLVKGADSGSTRVLKGASPTVNNANEAEIQPSDFNSAGEGAIKSPNELLLGGVYLINFSALAQVKGHSTEVSALVSVSPSILKITQNNWEKAQDLQEALNYKIPAKTPELLLSADKLGNVLLWNLASGKAYQLLKVDGPVDQLVLSPDQNLLAVGSKNLLSVYELPSLNKPRFFQDSFRGRITAISFHPDSQSLAVARADGYIYRWRYFDAEKHGVSDDGLRMLQRYSGHSTIPADVVYHPFGRVFFSADWNGKLNAWLSYDSDDFGGKYIENLFGQSGFFANKPEKQLGSRVDGLAMEHLIPSSDGRLLILGIQNGVLEFWRVRGFEKVSEVVAHSGHIYDVEISPDSSRMASVARDGKVRVWRIVREPDETHEGQASRVELIGEIQQPSARRLSFLSNNRLFMGTLDGAIQEMEVDRLPKPAL